MPRKRGPPDPFDPFHRAMGSTMFACEALGAALRTGDAQGVERAADDAVESWLAMRRALRHIELDAVDTGQRLQTARFASRAYRRALGDLLDRAQAQLAASSLHQLVAQLRLSLAIANDECSCPPGNERMDDPVGDV
ncbi:MAG: hypothetical protein ACREBE_00415 [bacterium]